MKIGASYYPELSDPAVWKADLSTARSLGMTAVRCGEFAWSRLSPEPGAWQVDWAQGFLDLAGKLGFDVIWCTPSATPPPYLFDRWPDLTMIDQKAGPIPVGVRRNYCPSHPDYRRLCGETAVRLVQTLGSHPAIKGWQIDNEIAGDLRTCCCERCGRTFQQWLQQRYGDLDSLNRCWQTDVWSQRYTRWEQIQIPHRAMESQAPALRLAWRRFVSDLWLAFYRAQYELMKAAGTTLPVTTNFWGVGWGVPFDQWAWRPYLDTIAIGQYAEDQTAVRFEYDLLRGMDGKALWVLEQKAGQQDAQNIYPESLERIGRHLVDSKESGAEYAIYWHLRQHQAGCEMEHGAVLRHDGEATRIGTAVKTGVESADRAKVVPRSKERVLVFDFQQQWAQETRGSHGRAWNYRETLEQEWYGAVTRKWGACVVGPLQQALAEAKVVLAPHLQMFRDEDFAAVQWFLKKGGTFITTADFGRLTWENNVRPLPPLGAWTPLFAPPVGETLHLKTDFAVQGQFLGEPLTGRHFWFVPAVTGSSHLVDEDFAGPVFLDFAVSEGRVCILTTALDRPGLMTVLGHITQ